MNTLSISKAPSIPLIFSNFHTLIFRTSATHSLQITYSLFQKRRGYPPKKANPRRKSSPFSANSATSVANSLLAVGSFGGLGSVLGDWGGGEDVAEDGEDFGDAEGLLEAAGFVGTGGRWVDEVAGHVDDDGFAGTGGGED